MNLNRWKVWSCVAGVLLLLALVTPSRTDLGWAYLSRREYAHARETFVEQLRRDPSDPQTWLGLAAVYDALGDPERQIAALETVARRFPGRRDARRLLADVYEWNRDPGNALRVLAQMPPTGEAEDQPRLMRLLGLSQWLGEYDRMVISLHQVLRAGPTARDTLEDLVVSARVLGRQSEVLPALVAYTERRPSDVEGQRLLAEAYDSLGDEKQALDRWRIVARLRPKDAAARARLLPEPGGSAPVEELALLERARESDPRDEAARRRLVEIYHGAGDIPRAIEIQRELVALRPRDAEALIALGRLLVAHDRGREAIAVYERALEIEPGRANLEMTLAQLYEWTNQPSRAAALLERASAARPGDRALAERVIAAASAAGDTDKAVAVLDRLARLYPDDHRYARRAADALVAANRVPEAIPRQRALLEREPGTLEPALRLAQLYEWTGREPDAIGVYEGLDRAGILPEGSALRLAQLYRFQNRPADFVRLAERLLSRRPDDASLRREAIETATGLGRADLALRLLRPLVDRQPADEALALRYLGLAAEARRLDDGLGVWRRFLAATPGAKIDARLKAGRLLSDLGRPGDAIVEYEAVVASGGDKPDAAANVTARLALAELYEATGAPAKSLAQLEALQRLRPRDPAILREIGRRSLALSRQEPALRAYQALLEQEPNDLEALKRVGQLLAWSGDRPRARQALERFNRLKGGDYEVHYLLGEIYTAEHDEGRARAEYEKALRLLPPRSATR